MYIITIVSIFIVALVAVFFPFMTFSFPLVKRYLLITAALCIAPLVIILIGNSLGWFSVNYLDAILLQRGVFSISFAVGYGIITGLLLLGFKALIISLFSRSRCD